MMDETFRSVEHYLLTVLGATPKIKEWSGMKSLPLYLREGYRFAQTKILTTPILLMYRYDGKRETPATLAKQRQQVAGTWSGDVLLVFSSLSALDRTRLIAAHVPFVVPGRQLFLPPLGIDLQELFAAPKAIGERLGPATQLLLLWAIEKGYRELPLPSELAPVLGYSKMTLSRAFDELEAHGLGMAGSDGRDQKTRQLALAFSGKALWEKAVGLMSSPVKKRAFVGYGLAAERRTLLSGFSALAEYSNLAAPDRKTYAAYVGKGERDPFAGAYVDEFDHNAVELELWTYDPAILAEGQAVDRLSLSLSLRQNDDERVSIAIDDMLGGIAW